MGPHVIRACKYNVGVDCEDHVCENGNTKCGWYPDTEKHRKDLLAKHELTMAEVREVSPGEEPTPMWKKAVEKIRKNSESSRERRDRYIGEGRCPVCGRPHDRPGKAYCSICKEKKREAQQRRRDRDKELNFDE